MKNTIIIVGIILIFLILYFIQVNFFNWFTISGISPNLFVIYVLFIGLFAGKQIGIPIGIVIGLLLDFFISKKIGILGIMLGIVGGIRKHIRQKLLKRQQNYYHYNDRRNHYNIRTRCLFIKLHNYTCNIRNSAIL